MNRNNKNAVNNTGVKKQYRWINDIEPVFMEDSKRNYGHRTWANAEWSDITLALAVDMDSPGEITTRKAAGDRYVGFTIPTDLSERCLSSLAEAITKRIRKHPKFKTEGQSEIDLEGRSLFVKRFREEVPNDSSE